MSLSPAATALIANLLKELGLTGMTPASLEVHFDRDGVPQEVKPLLSFRRALDRQAKSA